MACLGPWKARQWRPESGEQGKNQFRMGLGPMFGFLPTPKPQAMRMQREPGSELHFEASQVGNVGDRWANGVSMEANKL
jgi:hypothetical protein